MKISIITILCLLSSIAFSATENKEFNITDLNSFHLQNTSGSVKITATDSDKVTISANKVEFGSGCNLTMERMEDTVLVAVERNGWFNFSNCKVNFEIMLPKEIAINLINGSGNLEINGTHGKIEFKIGSGDAKIMGDISELNGKSGSGSINVSGLTGNAHLKAGSGNITASYKTTPKAGELTIKTGSGNATLFLPEVSKIATYFKVGSGKISNELGDVPNAQFKVSMKANSGNLTVKKL